MATRSMLLRQLSPSNDVNVISGHHLNDCPPDHDLEYTTTCCSACRSLGNCHDTLTVFGIVPLYTKLALTLDHIAQCTKIFIITSFLPCQYCMNGVRKSRSIGYHSISAFILRSTMRASFKSLSAIKDKISCPFVQIIATRHLIIRLKNV